MTATELIEMLTSFVSIHGDCEVGVEMNITNKNKCPQYDEYSKWISIFDTHTEFVPFCKDDIKVIEKMACGPRAFTFGSFDTTGIEAYDCDNCNHLGTCTHAKVKPTIKE